MLDSSIHHSAMKSINDSGRRGRPDIAHMFLLIANESILNREGVLDVVIHTRNEYAIKINPEMRVIKNYNRFKGLMEQLFKEGGVPPGGSLMNLESKGIGQIVKEMEAEKVILLSEKGKRKHIADVIKENSVCIIGGFPHGDFLSPVEEIADEIISIHSSQLPAWIALMEVIVAYEQKFMK